MESSEGQTVVNERRDFVLQVVQPGLAGLMDGSVSSLAPLFAAAFATRDSKTALSGRFSNRRGRGDQYGVFRSAF